MVEPVESTGSSVKERKENKPASDNSRAGQDTSGPSKGQCCPSSPSNPSPNDSLAFSRETSGYISSVKPPLMTDFGQAHSKAAGQPAGAQRNQPNRDVTPSGQYSSQSNRDDSTMGQDWSQSMRKSAETFQSAYGSSIAQSYASASSNANFNNDSNLNREISGYIPAVRAPLVTNFQQAYSKAAQQTLAGQANQPAQPNQPAEPNQPTQPAQDAMPSSQGDTQSQPQGADTSQNQDPNKQMMQSMTQMMQSMTQMMTQMMQTMTQMMQSMMSMMNQQLNGMNGGNNNQNNNQNNNKNLPPLNRPNGVSEINKTFGPPGSNQVTTKMPAGPGGKMINVTCNAKIADRMKAAFEEINASGLGNCIKSFDGAFCNRAKRGGSSKSVHSWGIAFDVNAGSNPMGSSRQTADQRKLAAVFAKYGFHQLANDPMHFQYATGY